MTISAVGTPPSPGVGMRSTTSDVAELRQASMAASAPRPQDNISSLAVQALSQTAKEEPTRAQLDTAVKDVNEFIQPINNALEFSVDDDTGQTVVKVIDKGTQEVIRQFPSEEMLAIARAIGQMKGLLVQQKA